MTTQPVRLLIVDDSALIREQLCAFLQTRFRFDMARAATAAAALARSASRRPDVAIVDINLPDRSGLALARDLRANQVAVILVTQCDCEEYRAAAMAMGAAFVAKDNLLRPLIAALRDILVAMGREESITLYCRLVPFVGADPLAQLVERLVTTARDTVVMIRDRRPAPTPALWRVLYTANVTAYGAAAVVLWVHTLLPAVG